MRGIDLEIGWLVLCSDLFLGVGLLSNMILLKGKRQVLGAMENSAYMHEG